MTDPTPKREPVTLDEQIATVGRVYLGGGSQPLWAAVLAILQQHKRAMAEYRKTLEYIRRSSRHP